MKTVNINFVNETKLYCNLTYCSSPPFFKDNRKNKAIGSEKVITIINFMLVPEVLTQLNFQIIKFRFQIQISNHSNQSHLKQEEQSIMAQN